MTIQSRLLLVIYFFAFSLLGSCQNVELNTVTDGDDEDLELFDPDSITPYSFQAIVVRTESTPSGRPQAYEIRLHWRSSNPEVNDFNLYRDAGSGWEMLQETIREKTYVDILVKGLMEYNYAVSGNLEDGETERVELKSPVQVPETFSEGRRIKVQNSGSGFGTVAGSGISCGSTCEATYLSSPVTASMTATPAAGSVFIGWDGPCNDTTTPMCTANLNDVTNLRAIFSPAGGGEVSHFFNFESSAGLNLQNGAQIVTGGKNGKALKLDGVNDFAETNVRINNYANHSIFAWLKIEQGSAQSQSAISQNGFDTYQWRVGLDGNEKPFYAIKDSDNSEAATRLALAPTAQLLDEWVHVGAVRNRSGNRVLIYVNGELQSNIATSRNGIWQQSPVIVFGRMIHEGVPGYYYGGMIDEVEIHDRMFSATEVLNLYNSQR